MRPADLNIDIGLSIVCSAIQRADFLTTAAWTRLLRGGDSLRSNSIVSVPTASSSTEKEARTPSRETLAPATHARASSTASIQAPVPSTAPG